MKDSRGIVLQAGQTVVANRPAGGFGKVQQIYGIVRKVNDKTVRIEDELNGDEFNKRPEGILVVELPSHA